MLVLSQGPIHASAIIPGYADCYVTAEVVAAHRDYLHLLILDTGASETCPLRVNKTYRAINNYYERDGYPAAFTEDDVITASIQRGSSNSPTGAVSFIQWEDIKDSDGQNVPYKLGYVISLQSRTSPVLELPIELVSDGSENNSSVYYLYGVGLVVVVLLIIYVLKRRNKS